MDDSKFDQSIRDKVARYQDHGIDPGALEGLHQRLAGVSYAIPWYRNYRNLGWIAASVVLISLLNFSLYSYIHGSGNQELLDKIAELKHDQQKLYELQNQLNNKGNLRAENPHTDTVYIYKEKVANEPGRAGRLEALIAAMSAEEFNDFLQKYSPEKRGSEGISVSKDKLYIAGLDEAPGEVKSYLHANSLFLIDHEGRKVPVTASNLPYDLPPGLLGKKGYRIAAADWHPYLDIVTDSDEKEDETKVAAEKKIKDVYLPSRILKVLEKNEMNGVGFRWGPEVELFGQAYDRGDGELQTGAGLLAELVLSPSLRLESGFKYTKLDYSLDDTGIGRLPGPELSSFPALNTSIGGLNKINVSSDIIGVPFNLKYFHPLTKKKKVFVAAGYMPMLYLRQQFEYSYLADIGNDIDEDDFSTSLKSSKRVDNPELYAGTFSTSLGLESQLKKNLFLQAALFYQKGITEMGAEGRDLELFGVRSSLWFRVK